MHLNSEKRTTFISCSQKTRLRNLLKHTTIPFPSTQAAKQGEQEDTMAWMQITSQRTIRTWLQCVPSFSTLAIFTKDNFAGHFTFSPKLCLRIYLIHLTFTFHMRILPSYPWETHLRAPLGLSLWFTAQSSTGINYEVNNA